MAPVFGVGIIGYGLSAKIFQIPYIKATPQFVLRGIVARSKANEAREDHPEVTVYESAAELLQDGGVDVVIVATPPNTHVDLASKALRAGKHGQSSFLNPRGFLVSKPDLHIPSRVSLRGLANASKKSSSRNRLRQRLRSAIP